MTPKLKLMLGGALVVAVIITGCIFAPQWIINALLLFLVLISINTQGIK